MTDVRELMWRHDRRSIFITKQQYLAALLDWDIHTHVVDAEPVGATLVRGPEFHYVTFGVKWVATRAQIRAYLEPILAEHGCVRTKTPIEDTRQQRFNEAIGFKPVSVDEFYVHYELTALRLSGARRSECQQ